ncbi:MAG: CCDC90 family protein [Burkholderiaceae bacterium]|jgi:hypothetical protein|nr:CCDC90 family protein [Burkholderiaceae bacterium]
MATATFDTLKYADTLEAAGFSREQAKAQASALSDALEVNLKDLATKADLRELELRMTVKLGAMLAAAVGIGLALAKILW